MTRTIRKLRNWQSQAFIQGRKAKYYLIQAPGGSGKSLLQVALAVDDIQRSGNKQLILVPNNHLHHGFYDSEAIELRLPGAARLSRWVVRYNFCAMSKNSPKVRLLKEFLLASPGELKRRDAMCAIATHRAFVFAWQSFSPEERQVAIKNLTLKIDEGHHMSNVFLDHELKLMDIDEASAEEDATQLGNAARFVINNNDGTSKMIVTTATFFRGDGRTIFSPEILASFQQYYLPWDKHFRTLG